MSDLFRAARPEGMNDEEFEFHVNSLIANESALLSKYPGDIAQVFRAFMVLRIFRFNPGDDNALSFLEGAALAHALKRVESEAKSGMPLVYTGGKDTTYFKEIEEAISGYIKKIVNKDNENEVIRDTQKRIYESLIKKPSFPAEYLAMINVVEANTEEERELFKGGFALTYCLYDYIFSREKFTI